jgi:hypothetical protein
MIVKFVIHLERGECRCFSDSDLKTNVEFALREGMRIVGVEAAK